MRSGTCTVARATGTHTDVKKIRSGGAYLAIVEGRDEGQRGTFHWTFYIVASTSIERDTVSRTAACGLPSSHSFRSQTNRMDNVVSPMSRQRWCSVDGSHSKIYIKDIAQLHIQVTATQQGRRSSCRDRCHKNVTQRPSIGDNSHSDTNESVGPHARTAP